MFNINEIADSCLGLIHKGRPKKGIVVLNNLLQSYPDFIKARFYRAIGYMSLEKYDRAILDLNKVLEVHKNYSSAYFNRAQCYIQLNHYEEALSDLNKTIQNEPLNNDAHVLHIRLLKQMGRIEEMEVAKEAYSRILKELADERAKTYVFRNSKTSGSSSPMLYRMN